MPDGLDGAGLSEDSVAGKISSRRVYSGRVISVDVDTVRFPNETVGELEMVRHSGASAVVPILDTGRGEEKVLLIRQYRYAAEAFLYEVPAGRLDPGESPEHCAERELKEETGYTASEINYLTTIFTTPGFTDERIHLFIAHGLVPGASAREADEILDLHPVAFSDALEMIQSGLITDGKTIIALLFADRFAELK